MELPPVPLPPWRLGSHHVAQSPTPLTTRLSFLVTNPLLALGWGLSPININQV